MTTKIADIIVPEVFNPYVVERTAELSELVKCGIISNDPQLDALTQAGGSLINMPFFTDLDGDDEVLTDSGALTPGKIGTGQDVAALIMRGRAWSVNDLAKALSGDDPMAKIGDLVAEYWARRRQALLFSILGGAMTAANMTSNIHDISGETGDAAKFTGSTFVDATQKMGDNKDKLTAIAMHSMTESALAKDGLIETIKDEDGKTDVKTYMGKRVIVDDGCPVNTDVYTSYLFGQGAIGYGAGSAPVPTETDRDSLSGEDILINRQHFVLHPRGIKFTSNSVAGPSPTNAEFANNSNWTKVYEPKNIRIVKFVHKIA